MVCIKNKLAVFLGIFLFGMPGASAYKEVGNFSYVQSGPDGVFYARAIPVARTSLEVGKTDVYRVQATGDELIDSYPWYTKHGVLLGWSPIAGKVTLLARRKPDPLAIEAQVELSLYVGGELVRHVTTADLKRLGAPADLSSPSTERARFQMLSCEQVPGTNDYVYNIRLGDDKIISLNILTGAEQKAVP